MDVEKRRLKKKPKGIKQQQQKIYFEAGSLRSENVREKVTELFRILILEFICLQETANYKLKSIA